MHDMITIGAATVDIFMKSARFHLEHAEEGVLLCQEYGGKIDIEDFFWQSGGAGTNTAVGFARLGLRTAAVVEVGKDIFGQCVYDELRREGVDTTYVVSEQAEQTAISTILISGQGGRSILTHRGASAMLEARDMPWEQLAQTRWIHLSNVAANQELLFQLFDHVRQTEVGLSWNPGKRELRLLAGGQIQAQHVACDILMVNREEWEIVNDVQQTLLETIDQVIVTDGKHGGQVYKKGGYHYQYQNQPVAVVQETGAGDAFLVGYVAGHILGRSVEECCTWGARNAASVISQMGAKTGLLTRRDFPR